MHKFIALHLLVETVSLSAITESAWKAEEKDSDVIVKERITGNCKSRTRYKRYFSLHHSSYLPISSLPNRYSAVMSRMCLSCQGPPLFIQPKLETPCPFVRRFRTYIGRGCGGSGMDGSSMQEHLINVAYVMCFLCRRQYSAPGTIGIGSFHACRSLTNSSPFYTY